MNETHRPITDQAEFTFSSDFRRPRGRAETGGPASRRATPPLTRPPRRRRGIAPATRRLAISREAFAAGGDDAAGYGGVVEAAVAIFATMAFGLGWAAYELRFDRATEAPEAAGSEYALVAPLSPLGVAGAEDAEWQTTNPDRYAREFMPTAASSAR
ncbi:MAG: hypothetical protein AAGC67_12380 [Myxococcota bacterium]